MLLGDDKDEAFEGESGVDISEDEKDKNRTLKLESVKEKMDK